MTISGSLTNRIFFATALVVILSIGLAIYVVNAAVTQQAEDELRRGLQDAATLVEHNRDLLFEQFAREARLIADLPKLKAAVGVDHAPTVRPIAADYQRQIGSDVFVVTNGDGEVLAQIGDVDLTAEQVGQLSTVREALTGRATSSFWPRAGGDLQVVTVPIWIDQSRPELLGTLSVGFSLDAALAQRFKQLTASEIAFLVDETVQATTLPETHASMLPGVQPSPDGTTLQLGGEDYVAVTRTLLMTGASSTWPVVGDDETKAPVAVILRSRTEQLEFLSSLQTALAGTALLVILVAVLVSYGVARTVTRPVGAIIATMREMSETGDLTKKIALPELGRWHDEDTRLLARTFNTMTDSILRFQHEAAQRERLSSLGRLSTVVAHEIRNPLMIIKAALRTLRRHTGLPDAAHTATLDIDEEVDRLNRVVGEVLDFARPIRFELDQVDLNTLCTSAVAAVAADEETLEIETTLDPSLDGLVTDGERVRLTLVNVLMNARHAVLERRRREADGSAARGGDRGADIELRTEAVGDAAVAISIRDRGVGIAPDDLPRVFDPYFTTKRTGSGLGLAIAKNVIEGLGGSITVKSEPDAGTEMRLRLPKRAEALAR